MNVENRIQPDAEQLAALHRSSADEPIVMINLLKFRERAAYPDGRDPQLSGRDAYRRYGAAFVPLLRAAGGRVLYVGDVRMIAIGRVDEPWDEVALAEYPSRAAFVALTSRPEYGEIAVHREAGLVGQLNIETAPLLALGAAAAR